MDDYSRYIKTECLAHRDMHSTLDSYLRLWKSEFHDPRRVRHDVDPSFSKLDKYNSSNGVKLEPVPPYTPQLDGQQERVHGTLENMFSAVMVHSGLPMTQKVVKLVFENHICNVYNNTVHSSTGKAPIQQALQIPPNLEQAATYYPGRPAVFKPDLRTFINKCNKEFRARKGRQAWYPCRCITQIHSNMVALLDEKGRVWTLPIGRVKLTLFQQKGKPF